MLEWAELESSVQSTWEYNRYDWMYIVVTELLTMSQYDRDGMVNPLQYLSQMRQDRGGMIQKTVKYNTHDNINHLMDFVSETIRICMSSAL